MALSRHSQRNTETRRRRLLRRGLLGGAVSPAVADGELEGLSPGWSTLRHLLAHASPMTIVATGDNVLAASGLDSERNAVELLNFRLRHVQKRKYDVVINTALPGDTVPKLLKRLSFRILRFRPQMTWISVGLNDARQGSNGLADFVLHLGELSERLRQAEIIPVFCGPHPIDLQFAPERSALPEYAAAFREWAMQADVPFLDLWDHWECHWPRLTAYTPLLMDHLHLSGAGQQEVVDCLCRAWGISVGQ